MKQDPKNFYKRQWLFHNLGLCMTSNPSLTWQILIDLKLHSFIIDRWIRYHCKLISFRLRKASFLGLVSVLSHFPLFENAIDQNGDSSDLFKHLLFEVFCLKMYGDYEEKIRDDDESLISDDDSVADSNESSNDEDTQFKSSANWDWKQSCFDFKKTMKVRFEKYGLEVDEMSVFESETVDDFVKSFDHISFFKNAFPQLLKSKESLLPLIGKFDADVADYIEEELFERDNQS